jgi:hypothetical protein
MTIARLAASTTRFRAAEKDGGRGAVERRVVGSKVVRLVLEGDD